MRIDVNVENVCDLRKVGRDGETGLQMSEASMKFRDLYLRTGLNLEQLARKMGFAGASSIQRYVNHDYKKKYLPPEFVDKAVKVMVGLGNPPIVASEIHVLAGRPTSPDIDRPLQNARTIDAEPPQTSQLVRDLPVRGRSAGGPDGWFELNGEVVDYVRRPRKLVGIKNAFAIYVTGVSMSPRYEEGELAFVHPGRPIEVGREVLIEMHPEPGEAVGRSYLKRLVRRTAEKVIVEQFNPPQQITFPVKKIARMYRAMTGSEVLDL